MSTEPSPKKTPPPSDVATPAPKADVARTKARTPKSKATPPAARRAGHMRTRRTNPPRGFRFRMRHFWLLLSFLGFVILPFGAVQYYFEYHAKPQYASTVGFVVRKADAVNASDVLGGISGLAGAAGNDSDILYEFIYSQEMVRRVDQELDLRVLYNKAQDDPIFALGDAPSIEHIVRYWPRMVRVSYDANTGLLELRVLAFDPQDAKNIAEIIFRESSAKVNELSQQARADATRHAENGLTKAVDRLKAAREELTIFRNTYQIVDPSVTLQERSGLLNSLQQQLAEATINYRILASSAQNGDPRLAQANQRISEIQVLIDEEQQKIGRGTEELSGEVFSNIFGRYEGLTVEREFAEQSYLSALQNYDAAVAQAEQQARYLSAYILPTLAESSQYPQRWLLSAILFAGLFFTWAIVFLTLYSLRDRR